MFILIFYCYPNIVLYFFTYKVLKHVVISLVVMLCFTPFGTYKVLKPLSGSSLPAQALHLYLLTRFSNHRTRRTSRWIALHLYLLTRFSNWRKSVCHAPCALHLYLLTRFSNHPTRGTSSIALYTFIYLQGSQTSLDLQVCFRTLYTFIYLQGSQTIVFMVLIILSLYTFIYLQGSQTTR